MPRSKSVNSPSDEPRALRVWKRDGSKNYMSIEAAIGNLRQNGHQRAESEILAALFRGETLETPRAEFRIIGVGERL